MKALIILLRFLLMAPTWVSENSRRESRAYATLYAAVVGFCIGISQAIGYPIFAVIALPFLVGLAILYWRAPIEEMFSLAGALSVLMLFVGLALGEGTDGIGARRGIAILSILTLTLQFIWIFQVKHEPMKGLSPREKAGDLSATLKA